MMRKLTIRMGYSAAGATLLACGCGMLPACSQQIDIRIPSSRDLTDPAVCDGVVYFGTDDGKLYAVNAADGSSVSGFPVDLAAVTGDGSYPSGRPAIYYGSLGKAIYVATGKQGIAKVWPNGTVAWVNKLDGTSTLIGGIPPAVTAEGEVIAEMSTGTNGFIVKLKESDGSRQMTSPPLAMNNFNTVASSAVLGNEIYLTVSPNPAAGSHKNVTVLNLSDLSVRASIEGTGFDNSPPYVRGGSVYFGSSDVSGAAVFKLNATTLNPDSHFGPGLYPNAAPGVTGVLPIGETGASEVSASSASSDRDSGGTVYACVANSLLARAVAINAASGDVRVLYSSGGQGSTGMVVSSHSIVAIGDGKTLQLFGVDGGHNAAYPLPGYPSRPCYDPTTNRFFVTTQPDSTGTSFLLGFDSP
jgi:hypothetical protein